MKKSNDIKIKLASSDLPEDIKKFYLEFSMYTNPGLYKNYFRKDLPNDIRKIGLLVRKNLIHRTTLAAGNTGTNADLRFGDMNKVPWYRQPEDDILLTVPSILAELYRRDARGFTKDRKVEDKLVLTCRFVAILIASILKSKGIPCRARAGHASYFDSGKIKVSGDHWINQYWNSKEKRWVTIDVDGSLSLNDNFDPYDIPEGKFDFAADAWLAIRNGKKDEDYFHNACGLNGLVVVFWSLFYDFHSLMNNEIPYIYGPSNSWGNPEVFGKLSESELKEIDNLAKLMQNPDDNFDKLQSIYNSNKKLRLLKGGLL